MQVQWETGVAASLQLTVVRGILTYGAQIHHFLKTVNPNISMKHVIFIMTPTEECFRFQYSGVRRSASGPDAV